MKKISLVCLLILGTFYCNKTKPVPERILGVWEKTSSCTNDKCETYPPEKVKQLMILRDGYAIYRNPDDPEQKRNIEYVLHLENTKSQLPEIAFRFLDLGFEIRYTIQKVSDTEMEFLQVREATRKEPETTVIEFYKRVGTLSE
ncbi:LIC10301 family lipoprotein [Leptospira wolffii]|uniref:LIC10301 family lipoprotein n=1 Tax=Leptospira wolffii TaxID=409998 RepID=UPI001A9C3D2D|nr:hypothetical protein [Leptospira wolffii]